MTSSNKVLKYSPNSKIVAKTSTLLFPVVGRCYNRPGLFFELGVVEQAAQLPLRNISNAFLCSSVTSYHRNDLHQRSISTPTSNESVDLFYYVHSEKTSAVPICMP